VLLGQKKFLNCPDPGEFTFARSTNGSRGFDAAVNFEASIVEFYCKEFNSTTADKEFISGFCGSSPSATAGYTMAGGVRVVVIHVLLTVFDGNGLLHIIGAASSAFRSGACLRTLEYILVSELVFVGGKAGGPGGSSTNSAGGLVPNFGSSSDGLPFRGRGIAKFLISFLQFFTACQGKDETFPVPQSELVLYFDSHNAKLCQFYSQCVPTPLDRHDTKTVKGRITLASFFQPCPELKPFLLRKRELHLEISSSCL
jgi:hypothetical protein